MLLLIARRKTFLIRAFRIKILAIVSSEKIFSLTLLKFFDIIRARIFNDLTQIEDFQTFQEKTPTTNKLFVYQNFTIKNLAMKIENLHSENCKTPVKFYASHLLKTIKRTSALSKFIAMQKQVSLRSNFISSTFNLFFNLAALKRDI